MSNEQTHITMETAIYTPGVIGEINASAWRALEEAIDGFGFKAINNYMKAIGWKYRGETPEVSDMLDVVNGLFYYAKGKDNFTSDNFTNTTASGGFEITYTRELMAIEVEIKFVAAKKKGFAVHGE